MRAWGAKVLSSATTVDEARWLEAHGVDAIIAQGLEAGGHRGMFLSDDLTTQIGTLALVPQIVAAVNVPVIAAGGIADASGVAAAMALGAAGVQVGTAYLLCPEATTSPIHRAALKGERRPPHRADQRVHRAAGPRHHEPDHARARADQRGGAGVSAGGLRDGAAARERRAPGPRRFLAAVVGRECQRVQRDSGGRSDARAGSRLRSPFPAGLKACTTDTGGPATASDVRLEPDTTGFVRFAFFVGFRDRSIRYASEAPTAIAPPRSAAPA